MTTDPTNPAPRYLTLRDYLAVLRRYWPLILAITIIGGAAGFADARRQTPSYVATTTVAFQDPSQALGLVGLASNSLTSPAALAAVNADAATGPGVLAAAERELRSHHVRVVSGVGVGTTITTTGLLLIAATSSDPRYSAALADAVASVLVRRDNARTQTQIATVTRDIEARVARLLIGRSPASTQLGFLEDELARLQTLGTVARSAQLSRGAEVPGSAASPHMTRSTAIGLALGLLLGILAAFFRDAMDRRIRTTRELEEMLGLPTLGKIRKRALGRVPQLQVTAGTDGLIDIESFRVLRFNLDQLCSPSRSRVVAVTSALPQEGKSTVAAGLAASMATKQRRTLLVDCDLRKGSLAKLLSLSLSPGFSDYLAGTATPQEALRTVKFGQQPGPDAAGPEGEVAATGSTSPSASAPSPPSHFLAVVPAGSGSPNASELLGSERFGQFIERVKDTYDVIVLDTSPLLPVADTREILPFVDCVVVCAREARTTQDEASAVREILERVGQVPAGLVVTGFTSSADSPQAYGYV